MIAQTVVANTNSKKLKKLIYYVATSIDGYIAGLDDDISQFATGGNGVEKYLQDLKEFQTVIMGRRTYEFGYKFGLEPGQPAYPHMDHHIFSDTLKIDNLHDSVHIESRSIKRIDELKQTSETDIYLCGGGVFAGWLLDNGKIDQLKIKLNPIILGNGIRMFGNSTKSANWNLENTQNFDGGLKILTYNIVPEKY